MAAQHLREPKPCPRVTRQRLRYSEATEVARDPLPLLKELEEQPLPLGPPLQTSVEPKTEVPHTVHDVPMPPAMPVPQLRREIQEHEPRVQRVQPPGL